MNEKRAVVVSDIHGNAEFLQNVLLHSDFDPEHDRLIFAGDLVDREDQVEESLMLLEAADAEFLLGNHDQAIALGFYIGEQERKNRWLAPYFEEGVLNGKIKVVAEHQGVLVSHGGVSSRYEWILRAADGDLAKMAEIMNASFKDEYKSQAFPDVYSTYHSGYKSEFGPDLLARDGPLWFRPFDGRMEEGLPLRVPQVAGHTPPNCYSKGERDSLVKDKFYLIHPPYFPKKNFYRYAVIDNGQVKVYDGYLGGSETRWTDRRETWTTTRT
jgi:hypothetical protein